MGIQKSMLVILVLVWQGCLDPIQFDTSDVDSKLVVEGTISLTERIQTIRLSQSVRFEDKRSKPVTGALVRLQSETLNETFEESEPGTYILPTGKIVLQSGIEYSISILTDDGNQYESIPEQMPYLQPATSLEVVFERDIIKLSTGLEITDDVLNSYLTTELETGTGEKYLRWFYDELYLFHEESCFPLQPVFTCYVPISGINQRFQLISTEELSLSKIQDFKVFTKTIFPLEEFRNRHYFIVYQQSITKQAFNYWTKVKQVSNQQGTVFDLPPATISGNVRNINDPDDQVLGYIDFMAVDTIRTFIFPSDFAEAITRETACPQFNRRNWHQACCNCSSLSNATLERPSWVN